MAVLGGGGGVSHGRGTPVNRTLPTMNSESSTPNAVALGRNRKAAARLKEAMREQRIDSPLFDTQRWVRFIPLARVGETSVLFARCAALKERCPLRQKSKVERLKAKVEPLLT